MRYEWPVVVGVGGRKSLEISDFEVICYHQIEQAEVFTIYTHTMVNKGREATHEGRIEIHTLRYTGLLLQPTVATQNISLVPDFLCTYMCPC